MNQIRSIAKSVKFGTDGSCWAWIKNSASQRKELLSELNIKILFVKILSLCIAVAFLFGGSCVYFRFLSNLKRLRFISMCSLGQATSEHKSWLHSNKCKTVHFAEISKSISFFLLSFLSSTTLILSFGGLPPPKMTPMSEWFP